MKPKPRQLALDLEAIESLRHMVHAAASTVDDLAKRLAPQTAEISSRIVLQHCEIALRLARGGSFNPQTRAKLDATYAMVKRELAA
jgi:hypothetical protein